MKIVRAVAIMIDDGERQEDAKTKLVLHLKIDEHSRIDKSMETFGYSEELYEEDGSYRKYPFILRYENGHRVPGKLSYEGWDPDSENRVNIHSKPIRVNETFTFFVLAERPEHETTYRIISVHTLCDDAGSK